MSASMYQQELMEHFKMSPHRGKISNPDYAAQDDNPSCGDRISITLSIINNLINDMKFSGSGCVISQASASILAEYLVGKPLTVLREMEERDILGLIKISLGPTRMRCATLSISVAKSALCKV